MCGCSQMTTTTMELPSLVCLCVLISCGVSSADANEPVKVKEGNDVILPCSLSTKENIESKLFDWKKDGQKEVFLYNAGHHYNNQPSDSQDRQFKGRAFHFQDELKHGNASIIIRDTTCSDSGNYTCIFPRLQPSQTFHIELIVNCILKDRTNEKIQGSASRPYVKTVQTTNGMKLQCEVLGVSPIPKVEWKDSSGNVVPADEPKINKGEKEGCYDVILEAPVTKTDNFSCIVTQEKINHQIKNDISGSFNGPASKPSVTTLDQTNDWSLLQCEVQGVSPKTKVEWKDSSGNIVPAKEPKITNRGGSYDIILQTTVTKTDRYRCVVTEKEINHQIYAETFVLVDGSSNGWIVAVLSILLVVVLLVAAVVVLLRKRLRKKRSNDESTTRDGNSSSELLEKSKTSGEK